MEFWENLARYGLMAAPYAAAPFTGGLSIPLQAAISGGIGAAQSAAGGGGLRDIVAAGGITAAQGAATPGQAPPETSTTPRAPGFWSKIADQAKEGLSKRDTYTTAAEAIAGALAASRANQPSMRDIQSWEYIAQGGRPGGSLGLTRPTTEREREEARKRLRGPGFWSQLLDYGVAPGLAVYGSMLPPYEPEGR